MLALEVKEMAEASEVLKKLGVGKITRHLLLCTGPKCCDESVGQKAWEAVKAEIASSGLGQGEEICFRTKVGCLRLCQQGPVALVYPEGVWYGEITADRVSHLVQQHLVSGVAVKEWQLAENRLSGHSRGEG